MLKSGPWRAEIERMVRLALFVLLVWTAVAVPLAVLIGALFGRLGDRMAPAPVVARQPRRVVDLRSR
jgi:hypothetical protein